MDFDKIISSIPDYKVFMTMDELDASSLKLAEEYPDTIEIRNIGSTKEDRPLYCLKAGRGSRNALVMGCPHPNEPIGTLMIESLAQTLAEHPEYFEELDYTFYMIKAIDPDGLVRNEGWLKGPFTYYNYARNYFRPAASQQVEWSFPLSYKTLDFNDPIPETQAVMKLIHEIKPSFIYSLHNSGFSGAFWYIHSKDRDKLARAVQKLPLIPEKYNSFLHRGEPEMAACEQYGDAVYETSSSGTSNTGSWGSSDSVFPNSSYPVFGRGGRAGDGSYAGVFAFNVHTGEAGTSGSFRPVVLSSQP